MSGVVELFSQELPDTGAFQEAFLDFGAVGRTEALSALAIIVVSLIGARFMSKLVSKALTGQGQSALTALVGARAAKWITVLVGFLVALTTLGVNIDALLGVLGLLGFALALAFRGVLENFVAGGLLLTNQPFELGDVITTGGHTGRVVDFSMRSTTISTVESVTVHVPNSIVVTEPLENVSTDGRQRTSIPVGVGYESDLDQVHTVLLEAVIGVEGVFAEPPPEVWFTGFGDSSVDFSVEFFHIPGGEAQEEVVHNVGLSIFKALGEADIEIPFPQRVNHTP